MVTSGEMEHEGADAGQESVSPAVSYLSLAEASRCLPGQPHVSTLHRWRLRGVRGIKLRTALIGGRRFTTEEWVTEFIAASTNSSQCGLDGNTSRELQRREIDICRAEQELEDSGI